MRKDQLHNRSPQLNKRKLLRGNLTKAEAVLWTLLKDAQLQGRKFRRQHGIEKFIVDFYCPSEKLIIELDGEVHNDPLRSAYDKTRQDRLEELGYIVIRFENKLVLEQAEAVLENVVQAFSARVNHPGP